jgi:8-oxo-dGTP pyrophosphatase MutT (NUDIX family)
LTDHTPTREAPTDDNPGGLGEATRAPARSVHPRNAASLILWRLGPEGPEVLMGLRHARHRFMPNVLVFPGGRVDLPPSLARAIGVAAARELHEETGLVLGRMDGHRLLPDLGVVEYLCRAVTPPNRFMRFNARFLIAPAEAAHGAIQGSGELEELRYFSFEDAFRHKIASITAKVLSEFRDWLALSPAEREARTLICFRGMDNRVAER